MPELKCKRCNEKFTSEAPGRIKLPVCSTCLKGFRDWLSTRARSEFGIVVSERYINEWIKSKTTM